MHHHKLLVALLLVAMPLAGCATPAGTQDPSPAESVEDPSPSNAASQSPSEDPTEAPTEEASPSPSVDPVLGDAARCESEELGYEVEYPGDWWANERIEPDDDNLTPIPACQYFAPSQVELQPNAGLPNGIAIRFEITDQEIEPSEEEVLNADETTIDGRDTRVIETEPAPQPGFVPEGSHVYRYIVELDDGRRLVAATDDILQDAAGYEESKTILDAMMETLEIDD